VEAVEAVYREDEQAVMVVVVEEVKLIVDPVVMVIPLQLLRTVEMAHLLLPNKVLLEALDEPPLQY
jgi:glucosamine 6-phosphate synthetase-like amidotransferase/phosphosugar isomerase protein